MRFFRERWFSMKMGQFWNCNWRSPFTSNIQVLHHFGKPQSSPLRGSYQFLWIASILGAFTSWRCQIGGPIPKKSVLNSIFYSGSFIGLLLRIPKWYHVPWNGHSKCLKSQKNQNLVQVIDSNVAKRELKNVLCEKSWLALQTTWVQLSKMVHHDRGCIRIWFGTHILHHAK